MATSAVAAKTDGPFIYPIIEGNQEPSLGLRVRALHKDEKVIFRLIESEKDDPSITDLHNKPRKRRPGYTLSGKKDILDPIAGRTVTIVNKSTKRTIKTALGEITSVKPEPIRFMSDKPAITIGHDEPEKYAYMMLMDENADNPLRNPKVAPVFEIVDNRKKVRKELEKEQFLLEALNWVMKEAKYNELISCAETVMRLRPDIKIKTDWKESESSHGFEMLKRELFAIAKDDPQTIIKGSTNIDSQVKMQIKDAEHFKQILYVDGKLIKAGGAERSWIHNDMDLTKITTLDVGQDKYSGLLEFFKTKEGAPHYAKMAQALEQILSPR